MCFQCEHTETVPSQMEVHLQREHKARKMCPQCGVRVVDMVFHMNTVHVPDDQKITCDQCGKIFGSLSNLKTHVLKHTKEKPYACRVCAGAFKLERALAKHMQKTHPGVKT